MQNVKGEVGFENNRIDINWLQGEGLTRGKFKMSGSITNPGPEAESRLQISLSNFPTDSYLEKAMKPEHRKIFNTYRNFPAAEKLRKKGLIRYPEDEGNAPVFTPGGRVNAEVALYRPPGKNIKPHITTDIDMTGANVLFKAWPYPVTAVSGHVIISPSGTTLNDLVLRGITGAEIDLKR